jgi:hypothetical protein
MPGTEVTTDVPELHSAVLDHAAEFVELVFQRAPDEYRRLLATARFRAELAHGKTFNHGKLYAYAEFSVFRREFRERFPEASPAACINAFSGLLLKNDISIHNLVEFIEGPDDSEQLQLNSPNT